MNNTKRFEGECGDIDLEYDPKINTLYINTAIPHNIHDLKIADKEERNTYFYHKICGNNNIINIINEINNKISIDYLDADDFLNEIKQNILSP